MKINARIKESIADKMLPVNATALSFLGGFVVAGRITTVAHQPAERFTNRSENICDQSGSSLM